MLKSTARRLAPWFAACVMTVCGWAGVASAQTAPTVTTATPSSVGTTSAVLGGTVTEQGSSSVTDRGVVYSQANTAPTIGGFDTTIAPNGTGTGTFSAAVGGLRSNTIHYVRAYVTNDVGTAYGSVISFTTAAPPIVVSPDTLMPATQGVAYRQPLTATGGGSYTYAVVGGATPAGITLSVDGVLSGTTMRSGDFSFTIRATDGASSRSGTRAYTLTVAAAPPAPIPTISEWAMILLGLLMAAGTVWTLHRRTVEA